MTEHTKQGIRHLSYEETLARERVLSKAALKAPKPKFQLEATHLYNNLPKMEEAVEAAMNTNQVATRQAQRVIQVRQRQSRATGLPPSHFPPPPDDKGSPPPPSGPSGPAGDAFGSGGAPSARSGSPSGMGGRQPKRRRPPGDDDVGGNGASSGGPPPPSTGATAVTSIAVFTPQQRNEANELKLQAELHRIAMERDEEARQKVFAQNVANALHAQKQSMPQTIVREVIHGRPSAPPPAPPIVVNRSVSAADVEAAVKQAMATERTNLQGLLEMNQGSMRAVVQAAVDSVRQNQDTSQVKGVKKDMTKVKGKKIEKSSSEPEKKPEEPQQTASSSSDSKPPPPPPKTQKKILKGAKSAPSLPATPSMVVEQPLKPKKTRRALRADYVEPEIQRKRPADDPVDGNRIAPPKPPIRKREADVVETQSKPKKQKKPAEDTRGAAKQILKAMYKKAAVEVPTVKKKEPPVFRMDAQDMKRGYKEALEDAMRETERVTKQRTGIDISDIDAVIQSRRRTAVA